MRLYRGQTLFRRSPCVLRKSFLDVEMGPEDPILGLTLAYQADQEPKKVNLGVGAYRGDDGKPYVLRCVRAAEQSIAGKVDHEYLPIAGLNSFVKAAQNLLFGDDSAPAKEKRLASVQTLSGTGALRVAAEFLTKHYTGEKKILLPSPTWANHKNIFRDAHLAMGDYRYYNKDTCGLDLEGLLSDLRAAPDGSIALFHACAHNPTGVDPTPEQWDQIIEVVREKRMYPFIDSAYQGFASGDPERDAVAVRKFVASGPAVITQSFAKNFGLYGQRVGALHFVCETEEEAKAVMSQLKILIRPMYSNPPMHGARLVSAILSDSELSNQWSEEVKGMAGRIISMRKALRERLEEKTGRKWEHVTNQIGMFCYTGLSPEQVEKVIKEHHVYMTKDGRISMAGVTSGNVDTVADAIAAVSK